MEKCVTHGATYLPRPACTYGFVQVLRQVEEEEGDLLFAEKLLSVSTCRAFEAEEDEDVFDRVAADSLHGLGIERRPPRCTEVCHCTKCC